MNKPLCRLRVLALSLTLPGLLWACGPKDVGTGTSAEATGTSPGVSVEDGLRYPVYGSDNTQRMLYWQNRPDVMAATQDWRARQFRRMQGLDEAASPEDPAYRAVPKQRSPFRQ
ncbi:chemotaxis protein [Desulfovibrio legallii]|jgi:hypothetical protein|uniref:Chemotaxis protein n=1 Tax=Desulfovibrio legallii TaxID=571438 RepID=A0A6H3F794_9BACT|nr:chemotaxis protein [Desulfovibrio legallii]TBH78779.1 chemotaxis protein [Desulfovibrio legallii]